MKGGAQAAIALGVGYVLGRRRKMRLATMLAIGAATGGIGGLAPAVMRRGARYLGSTDLAGALGPQVSEIVGTVRGELLDAAKGAATAAVTNRIDSLSDSLHDRAETLRNPEAAVGRAGETVGRAGETVGQAGGRIGGLRRRGRPAGDEEAAGEYPDDELAGEESGNGQARRGRPRVRRSARPEPGEPDEYDEPQDEYEEEFPEDELDEAPAGEADELDEADEEEPAPRRGRTSRSPVARTRR